MSKPKRYLITSALPYANGPLHIGHLAGAYLPADIFVRYLRLKGADVKFICGSDEHGAAITIQAKKEGITPKDIVDKYNAINKKAFKDFGITFDIYHRTSSELHHKTAADAFKQLNEQGSFIEKESEQLYDEEYKQFLADRYVIGTCPNCGNENAYGDQCENCGTTLSPTELINPRSTLSGNKPVLKKTTHWYLPLDKHQEWLKEWIETGKLGGKQHHDPKTWKKNVLGQCMSWLKEGDGLKARAVTRDLDWGVKVPVEGADGKVLYVWLDAPIGYISATKQLAKDEGFNWEDYWRDEDSHLIHFIGKDNIVFHCIIFPAILKELGEYNLPINVPANEFLNLEGDKISTSRNWAVWLHEYLEDFPDRKDELRYVLTAIAPETSDSEFTWKDYQTRVNSELVGILGNFVNRVLVLTQKYYGGVVPEVDREEVFTNFKNNKGVEHDRFLFGHGYIGGTDNDLKQGSILQFSGTISEYKFRDALASLMDIARFGNEYLAYREPWKAEEKHRNETLFICLQIVAKLAVVSDPFLPDFSKNLKNMLNYHPEFLWDEMDKKEVYLESGHQINEPKLLFKKVEDAEIEKQIEKLKASAEQNDANTTKYVPMSDEIQFDDFVKIDLRVGEIVAAEKVEKADKLLQLTIDLGFEQRTILSGVAQFFKPEDIVGQKVSVVANLAPRTMRGIESQGMVLMAEDTEGNLSFVAPPTNFPNGSVVR